MAEDARQSYQEDIASRLKNDMLNQYEIALRKKYDVEISHSAIERAIRPVDVE